jgi:hypothetical protein
MAISPDSERIALTINRLNTDVRLLDIERDAR